MKKYYEETMNNNQMQEAKSQLGQVLKSERKKSKLTKNAMMLQSKISVMQLSSIENASANYTIESLIKYSDSLGFKVTLEKIK